MGNSILNIVFDWNSIEFSF